MNNLQEKEFSTDSVKSKKSNDLNLDFVYLVPFIVYTSLVAVIVIRAFIVCEPTGFYKGTDSWSNICGSNKPVINSSSYSITAKTQFTLTRPYIWRVGIDILGQKYFTNCTAELMKSPVDLCVDHCPFNITSLDSCKKLLEVLGHKEDSKVYYQVINQCKLMEKVFDKCKVETSTISALGDILSRCVPTEVLNQKYEYIKDFLSGWHFLIHDFIICFQVLLIVFMSQFICSLIVCFVVSVFFSYAFYAICNILSIILFLVCSLYFASLSVVKIDDKSSHFLDSLTVILIASFCIIFLFISLSHSLSNINIKPGMNVIFDEASEYIRSNPKIMGLALGTILINTFVVIVFGWVIFTSSACLQFESEPSILGGNLKININLNSLLRFEWLILSIYGVWTCFIISNFQNVFVSNVIHSYYFSEQKLALRNQIISSIFKNIWFNTGKVVASSFSGHFQHIILSYLFKPFYKFESINAENPRKTYNKIENLLSYISPYSAVSIGINGCLKPTFLCQYHRKWVFPQRAYHSDKKINSRYATNIHEKGIDWIVKQSTTHLKALLKWLQIGLTFSSLILFYELLNLYQSQLHILGAYVIFTFLFSYFICTTIFSVLYVAIDTIAVCFVEDLSKNNGSNLLYLCKHTMIQQLTGFSVGESSTHPGKIEIVKRNKIKEKKRKLILNRQMKDKEVQQRNALISSDMSVKQKNKPSYNYRGHRRHRLSATLGAIIDHNISGELTPSDLSFDDTLSKTNLEKKAIRKQVEERYKKLLGSKIKTSDILIRKKGPLEIVQIQGQVEQGVTIVTTSSIKRMNKEWEILKSELDNLKMFSRSIFKKEQIKSEDSLNKEESKRSIQNSSYGGSVDSIIETSRKSSKKSYSSNVFK